MERKELVKKALEAGITKANTMKSIVLEEMLKGVTIKEKGKRGRPVNENSVRQIRLKELEEKRVNGELRRGRPVNEESVRQMRLKTLEEKRVNGELKKGRPVNENSVRQMRLKEMELKRMNGELRRGRPKMNKSDNNEVAA
jgi:uncharacterized protein YneF (UPF0154 family)